MSERQREKRGTAGAPAAAAAQSERKLPRVDLRKLLAGGVAGRREAIALVGDALRHDGAVRVEGHGATDRDGLTEVGIHLLGALAEYFGLAANAFPAGVATSIDPGWPPGDTLLVVVAGVPAGTELRAGAGDWRPITAHPGELAAVPSPRSPRSPPASCRQRRHAGPTAPPTRWRWPCRRARRCCRWRSSADASPADPAAPRQVPVAARKGNSTSSRPSIRNTHVTAQLQE